MSSPQSAARCEAVVYRRDTYRRTGRGKTGFEMHYARGRCARAAVVDGWCRQHAKRPQNRVAAGGGK